MDKKFNYVYITTNLINGKQYVGSHATDNIDDGYIGPGRYFLRSLRKEGKQNFKREILEECNNREEAILKEEFYILKFKTLCPHGYNMCPKGGIGFSGASHSEITKEKQARWQKGKSFEELYGADKARLMKEKISQRKKGISTKRKGRGHKKELIEKYGESEGLNRYRIFIEKQKNTHIGKKQSVKTIEKRKETMGEPWNKGKSYTLGPYSEERKAKLRKPKNNTKYKRILTPELKLKIQDLYKNGLNIQQIMKNTPIKNFYKIKEIVNI